MSARYEDRYLSKEEVALRYDMSPRTLDRMLHHIDAEQRFPPPSLHMERLPYWSVLDLDRFDIEQIEFSKNRSIRRPSDEYLSRPGQKRRASSSRAATPEGGQ